MRELEHMFYAHAVGVDYQNNQFKIYVQILDFTTLGKQESGGGQGDKQGSWVGKGVGKTFQAALHDLYATTQRRIYWGHVNTAVLSEAVLKFGIHEILDQFTRYSEFRYSLWIFGTQNSVEDILLSSPIMESSPVYSQLGDPTDVYDQNSSIHPMRLYSLITDIREPGKTVLLPMINLSEGHWVDNKMRYRALKVGGVGIIDAGKWYGFLSAEAFTGARWLDSRAARIPLALDSEKQPVATVVFKHPQTQITPEIRQGKVFFNLKIKVRGNINEMDSEVSDSIIRSRAEEMIREEIRNTFAKGLKQKVDALNLLESLYRQKNHEWAQLKASKSFPLTEDSLQNIEINISITSRGRTTESFPINGGKE